MSRLSPDDENRLKQKAEEQTGLKKLRIKDYSPGQPGMYKALAHVVARNGRHIGYFQDANTPAEVFIRPPSQKGRRGKQG